MKLEEYKEFNINDDRLIHYNGKTTDVVIPNHVRIITQWAFEFRRDITSITFGANVAEIYDDVFRTTISLRDIYYNGTIEDWCSVSFSSDTSNPLFHAKNLYLRDENGHYNLLKDILIPESVKTIGSHAFINYRHTKNVIIGDGVKNIHPFAFSQCDNLSSVEFGENIESIGAFAFQFCEKLRDVILPHTLTIIGQSAFYKCTSFENITIPDSIRSIETSAFTKCDNVKSLIIGRDCMPTSDVIIHGYAFSDCTSLIEVKVYKNLDTNGCDSGVYPIFQRSGSKEKRVSLFIGENVTRIGDEVFRQFRNLNEANIGSNVEYIGIDAFVWCGSLEKLTFGNESAVANDVELRIDAFMWCHQLSNIYIYMNLYTNASKNYGAPFRAYDISMPPAALNIFIGNNVREIGCYVFYLCGMIENIHIGSSVELIGSMAFASCCGVESVFIPKNVKTIADSAFLLTSEQVFYEGSKESLQADYQDKNILYNCTKEMYDEYRKS